MDGPITPLDRASLYPNSSRVTPSQESDKEKDKKKFSEELEEEIDEDEQKRRAKHDTVEIGQTDPVASETTETTEEDASGGEAKDAPRHIDVTA